ncbi:MAG: hypothetical protein QW521_03660 [Desulfurococcaceae archaeon]
MEVPTPIIESFNKCIRECIEMFCPKEDKDCRNHYIFVCEDICLEEVMESE